MNNEIKITITSENEDLVSRIQERSEKKDKHGGIRGHVGDKQKPGMSR